MRFRDGPSSAGYGVHLLDGDDAVGLTALESAVGPDPMGLIEGRTDVDTLGGAIATAPSVLADSVVPALPVANPGKPLCLGLNYVDHIRESDYDVPTHPALFMRCRNSLTAAGEPMVRPTCSERLNYEAELMVIIGKGGKHIAEEDTLSHVFGYTLFNDGTVRDYQRKTHQWAPGKTFFDDTGEIGPDVVTPDELPEGAVGLKIECRVGDEILQSATTSDMLWSVAEIIATISEYSTLGQGDMIAMGTPPGVGHAKTPPRWLRPGETVKAEIEGMGFCASPIVAEENIPTMETAE